MMQFDRMALGKQAKELGFVRDTFEKVCRLADVLKFFEGDDLLSEYLALTPMSYNSFLRTLAIISLIGCRLPGSCGALLQISWYD